MFVASQLDPANPKKGQMLRISALLRLMSVNFNLAFRGLPLECDRPEPDVIKPVAYATVEEARAPKHLPPTVTVSGRGRSPRRSFRRPDWAGSNSWKRSGSGNEVPDDPKHGRDLARKKNAIGLEAWRLTDANL